MKLERLAILNELSLATADSVSEAVVWFGILADVAGTLLKLGFRGIRTNEEFSVFPVAPNFRVCELLHHIRKLPTFDLDQVKVLTQVFKYPYINDSEIGAKEFIGETVLQVAHLKVTRADGVLAAWATRRLAVSIRSAPHWDCRTLKCIFKNAGEQHLRHVATTAHSGTIELITWAAENLPVKDQPSKEKPFPDDRSQLVKFLMDSCFPNYRKELLEAGLGKEARITVIGDAVAAAYGYEYSKEVSDRNRSPNRLRRVFRWNHGSARFHISTDFETGGFEVCDKDGWHLGEWSFEGKQTKGPAQGHGIHV